MQMDKETIHIYVDVVSVVVMFFTVGIPVLYQSWKFREMFRYFPPHRHESNGDVVYPPGVELPTTIPQPSHRANSASAGR